MASRLVPCVRCRTPYPLELFNRPEFARCPACGIPVRVEVFPALFRPLSAGDAGREIEADREATCYYHPAKQAVIPCGHCGRFLCALCDIDYDGVHYCPGCLDAAKQKGNLATLIPRHTRYDDMALTLALGPLLIWPFTMMTAPAALYVILRYWRAPLSIIPRSRARFVLALLAVLPQLALWLYLGVKIYRKVVT